MLIFISRVDEMRSGETKRKGPKEKEEENILRECPT